MTSNSNITQRKEMAAALFREGNTLRFIGRSIGSQHRTVKKWLVADGIIADVPIFRGQFLSVERRAEIGKKIASTKTSERRKHIERCIGCLHLVGLGKWVIGRIMLVSPSLVQSVCKNKTSRRFPIFRACKSKTDAAKERQTNQTIARSHRCRVRDALKTIGRRKEFSARSILGCSVDDFRKMVAAQFNSKMNWDNYGTYWHLDHVIPCSAFDLSKEEEIKRCFHFSNYRPLCARKNLSDGARKNQHLQQMLLV